MAKKYTFGKKKTTFGGKVKNGLRKTFLAVAAAGTVGGFGYYNYGTVETERVTVTSQQRDYSSGEGYTHTIRTTRGTFVNEPARMHFKTKEETEALVWRLDSDKTYEIRSFGINFGPFERNILDAREIPAAQLRAEAEQRAREAAAKGQQQAGAPAAAGQPPVAGVVPAQGGAVLSGQMETVSLLSTDGRGVVEVTMPIEARGKVFVNKVQTTAPAATTPPPAGPTP